jgi:hypothetical protein
MVVNLVIQNQNCYHIAAPFNLSPIDSSPQIIIEQTFSTIPQEAEYPRIDK